MLIRRVLYWSFQITRFDRLQLIELENLESWKIIAREMY